VVASAIDDLVHFHHCANVLNNYLSVVFEYLPKVFLLGPQSFDHPAKIFYLPDGVHLNVTISCSIVREWQVFVVFLGSRTRVYILAIGK
jgi:hypothetical protein